MIPIGISVPDGDGTRGVFPGNVVDVIDRFSAKDLPSSKEAIFYQTALVGDVIKGSIGSITGVSATEGVCD